MSRPKQEKDKNELDPISKKEQILATTIVAIEKAFGTGSIMSLDDESMVSKCDAIPTGSISLDKATGIGGVPRGRIIEIYGQESSAKSSLCLHIVANAQKNGGIAAYIDVEHALDPEYSRKLGVDISKLRISQPDHAEQALNIMEHLIRSGVIDIVVLDSVAALVPEAELDGTMDEQQIGLQARLMSKALRKLTGLVAETNTCLIFVNQTRVNIGQFFGDPTTTPGGKALKYHASMRIELRRTGWIKEKDTVIGSTIRAKVVKNKLAPPYRVCEFPIIHGQGISEIEELIDIGLTYGIIKKAGPYFKFDEIQLGLGKPNTKELLYTNNDLYQTIKAKVINVMALGTKTIGE